MRNKKQGRNDTMSVASIRDPNFIGVSAKRMSSALLQKEHRGPGDTIEATAYRCQTKYGVDADIILQGWRRPIQEMKASRWLWLFHAYCAAGLTRLEAAYEDARDEVAETDPALVRLADFVAGRAAEEAEGAE